MNEEETSFFVSAVEKRTGPGGSGGSGEAAAAPAPPSDGPSDDRPGEPQPQVAMEA